MTYLQILNTIKDTALAQPNVNSVVREFLDLNREDAKYSAVVIQDRDGSRDRIEEQDYITYTWHLGYVDRLTYDESNRDDIISTGINIINNIVNTIRNTWFPELEVSLSDRINTFDQRFTAQCAGVYGVLSVNALVSDCIDSESTSIYDKFKVDITENGDYHFVPSGKPVDEIDITVNVENRKPEESLVETITSNGSYSFSPTSGSVFSGADITVDVHPTDTLSETYVSNGSYNITGEFSGGVVNVDVHPSNKLVETITSNGNYSYSGEYAGAEITVTAAKTEESLERIITSNGNYIYSPEEGSVFSDVSIAVDVHPSASLSETYTTNGEKTITGEFNGGTINIDVHPSNKLVETITTNGITDLSGEWKDASISVDVHPSASLSRTYVSNGSYNITGEWKDASIKVEVPSDKKPEKSLIETITTNGSYSYSPEEGSVFSGANITVDVHPSVSLSRSYTTNGTKTITGEFNGGTINIDVHPSNKLVETITSNGSYSYTDEYAGAEIMVNVPGGSKPEESLVETITSNGSYSFLPNSGSVFSEASITVNVPSNDIVTMTQAEYNALSNKNPNTIYLING